MTAVEKIKTGDLFRNALTAIVVASLGLAFFDELGRYILWPVSCRNILTVAEAFFDLLFTAEFIAKAIIAARKKSFSVYWKHGRGWADFFASVPLLILDLPSALLVIFFAGGAGTVFISILMFIKNIKAARILHFIRIIKIYTRPHKGDNAMVNHHISSVSTIAACALILTTAAFSFLKSPADHKIYERGRFYDDVISTIIYFEKKSNIPFNDIVNKIFADDKYLLRIMHKDKIILERIPEEKFKKYYTADEYTIINNRGFGLYYSIADLNGQHAFDYMVYFFMLVFTALMIMIFYKRHFTDTVADIIKVINRGFRTKQYSEPVKIIKEYEEEDLFKLAKFYNEAYLPAKMKRMQKDQVGK